MTRCSGISASWCPAHGDCICPRDEDGVPRDWYDDEREGLNRPDCPLHGESSTHGDDRPGQLALGERMSA